ncbi:NUDIX hydrolase [Dietzia sp. E1]|nr:NUDIX hydrolase [Dietzia sp. E1]
MSVAATSISTGEPSYAVGPRGLQSASFARSSPESLESLVSEADRRYSLEAAEEDDWAAFIFVQDQNGRIAMSRTKRSPEFWSPIGGRRKKGDPSPLYTAVRELEEETTVRSSADALHYLGSRPRDIGEGLTHFWSLQIPDPGLVTPDTVEFAEFRWVEANELSQLCLYGGTAEILKELNLGH